MNNRIYGYIRVSTREQNIDRQIISLREANVDKKTYLLTGRAVRISGDQLMKK